MAGKDKGQKARQKKTEASQSWQMRREERKEISSFLSLLSSLLLLLHWPPSSSSSSLHNIFLLLRICGRQGKKVAVPRLNEPASITLSAVFIFQCAPYRFLLAQEKESQDKKKYSTHIHIVQVMWPSPCMHAEEKKPIPKCKVDKYKEQRCPLHHTLVAAQCECESTHAQTSFPHSPQRDHSAQKRKEMSLKEEEATAIEHLQFMANDNGAWLFYCIFFLPRRKYTPRYLSREKNKCKNSISVSSRALSGLRKWLLGALFLFFRVRPYVIGISTLFFSLSLLSSPFLDDKCAHSTISTFFPPWNSASFEKL